MTPEGVRPGGIVICDGVIREVVDHPGPSPARHSLDVGELVVMPGVVDPHVHINDPGRCDWEGFQRATQAAAAGGTTTLVDMPLNSSPVTTDASALDAKLRAATGRCWVDYGLWGGVVPGNAAEITPMLESGALGVKCFLVPSGLDEFPCVAEDDLDRVMPILAERGAPLLVHAEVPEPIEAASARAGDTADGDTVVREYSTYLSTRPDDAETRAIELMIRLSARHGCRVHIVHVSSEHSLPLLAQARERGVSITAETCPHYLTYEASGIPSGATEFKCAPPIRRESAREGLWAGLQSGALDLIASDHSPCPPELKQLESGDFLTAWGGISSLQLSLPAVWTQARARGQSLIDVARWMCEAPARLIGMEASKGRVAPGCDADLVIWNPEESFVVEAQSLYHRHKVTPYDGVEMYGTVNQTLVRGRPVFVDGNVGAKPIGRWLTGRSG